jgi:rod shape-determining protein MreD
MHPTYIIIVSFGLGLSSDIVSSGIIGSHAAACTFAGYCRSFIIKISISKSEYENMSTASASQIKLKQFTVYTLIFVFLHHFSLFLLEIFTLQNFGFTLIRIVVSSIISTIFIILIKLLFFRTKKAT